MEHGAPFSRRGLENRHIGESRYFDYSPNLASNMNLFVSILFWAGIAFLVDGSFALLFQEKWQKLVRGMNIQRIAWIEIGVGWAFLAAHYILDGGV